MIASPSTITVRSKDHLRKHDCGMVESSVRPDETKGPLSDGSSSDAVKPEIVETTTSTCSTWGATEQHRVVHICRSILAVLKYDSRQVNPSRFTRELPWSDVYGELYLKVDEQLRNPDRLWIEIILEALSQQNDLALKVRVGLLKAVADGLALNLISDYGQVAESLLHYHSSAMEPAVDLMSDLTSDDDMEPIQGRMLRKRSSVFPIAIDEDQVSNDVPLWFHICGLLTESGHLSSATVLELWMACWKHMGLGRVNGACFIVLHSMAIQAPNVEMVHHVCSVLLSGRDCTLKEAALSLLSSLLEFTSLGDSLAAKAVTFLALTQRQYLQDCFLVMNKILARISLIEFEVFVEAVVLRLLREGTDDEKELCLNFISDMCMPPTVYLNFDCQILATDLWETMLKEISNVASPVEESVETERVDDDASTLERRISSTAPNRSALNTIVNGTACGLNHLNRLALKTILRVLHSFDKVPFGITAVTFLHADKADSGSIIERRKWKDVITVVSNVFNTCGSDRASFLRAAKDSGILESESDAKGVARFFHESTGINKRILGEYLSQGPASDFPFQAEVRKEYVGLLSFGNLNFPDALRKFLSHFRLPGEAQCIDRLMEAFSEELYRQQGQTSIFRNADAVYVLSFSTIMLQTDLHNPTIKSELRMTKEQFVRNNRGINGGDDLPEAFIGDLYDKIKGRKLDVQLEIRDFMLDITADFDVAWSEATSISPRTPVTLAADMSQNLLHTLFRTTLRTAMPSMFRLFSRSSDHALIVEVTRAIDLVVRVADLHGLHDVIDDVLLALLPMSKDYILSCFASSPVSHADTQTDGSNLVSPPDFAAPEETVSGLDVDDTTTIGAAGLLISATLGCIEYTREQECHSGLIAVDRSLLVLQKHSSNVNSATFVLFIECLCALRDIRALPKGMSNLDDFADSSGNVLPLSSFARDSQKRIEEYNRLTYGRDTMKSKGWFRSFFRKGRNDDAGGQETDDGGSVSKEGIGLSSQVQVLLDIAMAVDVESIVQTRASALHDGTIEQLLRSLDSYPFENDPAGEQNAIFSLELAARALLSYPSRSEQSFLPFLSKFESILCKIAPDDDEVPSPFVIERIVVTILRSCIHLYSFDEVSIKTSFGTPSPHFVFQLRPHLRASLQLLIMTLPRAFIRLICDRFACGLAIILRSSFQCFGPQEWSFMGDTLDTLANFNLSRVFVFDGIASTLEYSVPEETTQDISCNRPKLTVEACGTLSRILTRFVLGFYSSDASLTVPALLCLEKAYRRKVIILTEDSKGATAVPDVEAWQNVTVAIYSACRSTDEEISHEGFECFQRNILNTEVKDVSSEKWVAILYLLANKQPPVTAESSRSNGFSLLGQLIVHVVPSLSLVTEHREDLEDVVGLYAALAEENLSQSQRGELFKRTLQTLTYVSNHMVSNDWKGEKEFACWASDIFFRELERSRSSNAPKSTATAREEEDVSEISDSAAESEIDE